MNPQVERWLSRIFRLMVYLYPASFRQAFAREMTQVFIMQCRVIAQRGDVAGLVGEIVNSLADVVKAAIIERWVEGVNMSRKQIVHLAGWAAIAGGALFLVSRSASTLFGSLPGAIVFDIALNACFLLGFLGLALVQKGKLSQIAAGGVMTGFVLLLSVNYTIDVILHITGYHQLPDPILGWVAIAGAFCFILGLLILGTLMARHRPLPRSNVFPLALAVGLVLQNGVFVPLSTIVLRQDNLNQAIATYHPQSTVLSFIISLIGCLIWSLFGWGLLSWREPLVTPRDATAAS